MKRLAIILSIVLVSAGAALAQNSNTSPSSRTRTVAPKPSPTPKTVAKSPDAMPSPSPATSSRRTTTTNSPAGAVRAAFDKIIEGIRKADVDLYMSGYLNSPTLVLFNNNGTVTRGWDQLKRNRESSFPQSKDVKLDIKDWHVTMLGRDGAVVSCLWTQTQTFNGQPDSGSGRMTLVFKRVGTEWKAVHLHTSPDKPDPSRVPASEQSQRPMQ